MNIVYKAVTKHTKQMLRDFVRFTYRMQHPKSTFRLCVFGAGFWTLTPFLRGDMPARILLAVFGGFIVVFALTRHLIAANRLAEHDEYYQKQTEIIFLFGEKEFSIQTGTDEVPMKYTEISQVYKDKRNYYLWLNNEDIQVLPRADFATGDEETYETFISQKIKKEVLPLYLPLRERLILMNEARKQAEKVHDEKIQKKKEEHKHGRANKK